MTNSLPEILASAREKFPFIAEEVALAKQLKATHAEEDKGMVV